MERLEPDLKKRRGVNLAVEVPNRLRSTDSSTITNFQE